MSAAGVDAFLDYWATEGQTYAAHGDYAWMAGLVPGRRVLEIGCGLGFATQALAVRGLSVLAIDSLPECLAATQARVAGLDVQLLAADLLALTAEQAAVIESFAPDSVVCWLMGAPAGVTGALAGDGGQAVVAYRERLHRRVAELAASLPSATVLHLVDRTAIPWQAKDIGRDTLVRYHATKTLHELPFLAERRNACFRKLASTTQRTPALKGVVPTLASLLAERKN